VRNKVSLDVLTCSCVFTTRAARVVLFSIVSVCVLVLMSVNAITPGPLEISPMIVRAENFENDYIGVRGW